MPKIEPYKPQSVRIRGVHTDTDPKVVGSKWWTLSDDKEIASSLFGVIKYLKQNQSWRQKQASLYARLYGNLPLSNYFGTNLAVSQASQKYPSERPTMNVVQSCIDALVSRMVQSKPKPMFLTTGGDYKKRRLAKDLNQFIDGEFYQTNAYDLGEKILRDSVVLGDGFFKVYETDDKKVGLERVLCTEIFVDDTDGMYGSPQQLHQLKIIDRDVVAELYPDKKAEVMSAQASYFDGSPQSTNSITSQVLVCESWHLPSAKEASDGKHIIAIDSGVLVKEDYKEMDFPFVKMPYAPRTLGYWAQGLSEQLMGIQNEINRLLYTIQRSLHLCGIPKWLVEDGSKVVSGHIDNQIGGIIKYSGTAPVLQVAQSVHPEIYAQLERLVQFAYQQSGISMLAAASQKPAGLNSGVALREYDDLQSDRFAYLSQRYEKVYLELADKMFAKAREIARKEGKYHTIAPGKTSILKIDLPIDEIKDDEFIIQSYPASAFSKHPAQRKQEIIDLMQAGLIDQNEGRRLLDYPDLQQVEDLLNAPEERILKILDEIVEDGEYTPPDSFMDLDLAKKLCIQYLNKYVPEKLDEEKTDMLRTFSTQIDDMQAAAMDAMAALSVLSGQMPQPMASPQGQPRPQQSRGLKPQAQPEPSPVSPMLPNAVQ